jgi:formate C-acetyltransferase
MPGQDTGEETSVDDAVRRRERAQWIAEHRNYGRKALLFARGYRDALSDPLPNVRRARAIAHVLEHYPVEVGEDDLLVGRYTSGHVLSEDERCELAELGKLIAPFHRGLPYGSGGLTGGHRVVDYELLLKEGVQGILDDIARRERALDGTHEGDAEAASFYEASRIVLNGLLTFADRYRVELEHLADVETDPRRRERYGLLAGIFVRVPRSPARSFHEAMQSAWFVQFALGFDDVSCTGRPDQYLYPYYAADMESSKLTRESALRLIEELYLRSNEVYSDWPETIMVGGLDREGRPVLNDLTYLLVEAVETVGLVNPNVAICYREDTPDDLLLLGLDKIAKGFSHPAIYNDRVITQGLVEAGLRPGDARQYINSTCVEITPIGCSNVQVARARIYPVKVLEMMLNGGRQILADEHFLRSSVGADVVEAWSRPIEQGGMAVRLDEFDNFEGFVDAYKRQLGEMIRACIVPAVRESYRVARYGSSPLVSCFTHDCVERGRDAATGGARYNYCGTVVAGFVTAVDSLLAIREAVYREGRVSFDELVRALRSDFEGCEDLRQYLLHGCPRYGNDIAGADALAVELYDFIVGELSRYRTCLGGGFHIGLFSGWGRVPGAAQRSSLYVAIGSVTAATPDGRRQGTPLSENIGPSAGADREGLTAMTNSVTKMDHRFGLGGISLNCRLSPTLFRAESDRRKIVLFLREYMRRGGFQIQLSALDSATLREAQALPERHRNLMVRVAGYSDYFRNLSQDAQNDIIARTEHSLR